MLTVRTFLSTRIMVIWREILWSQRNPFPDPCLHFSLARERRRRRCLLSVSLSNVRNVQAWPMTYEVKVRVFAEKQRTKVKEKTPVYCPVERPAVWICERALLIRRKIRLTDFSLKGRCRRPIFLFYNWKLWFRGKDLPCILYDISNLTNLTWQSQSSCPQNPEISTIKFSLLL